MLSDIFLDTYNRFDFTLRSLLRFRLQVRKHDLESLQISKFQWEMREFLGGFDWARALKDFPRDAERVCLDVGAKNFAVGPVIERMLQDQGLEAEIYGIEVDAYRRSANLRSRADYGRHFAAQMQRGAYIPRDFLDWDTPADLMFVLNPFVSSFHHLHWGLPIRQFRPEAFFEHCVRLLRPPHGLICLCCPTRAELKVSSDYLGKLGMEPVDVADWRPSDRSLQRQARLGQLWRLRRKSHVSRP